MDIIILVHIDYVHSRFSTLSTHDVHNIGSTTCPSANHIVSTCTFVHFIYIYIYCIYIVYILCTIYRLYIICVLYIQYMHMHYRSCKLNISLCVLTLIINIYIYSMPWTIYLYIAWIVYTI